MSVNIELLYNDGSRLLVAKADLTKDELLKEAIKQNVIDDDDFVDADYYQSYFKVCPAPRNSDYKNWNYPVEKGVKGAYFASVLEY